MTEEGMMDWNARAADYPLNTDRPSIRFILELLEREVSDRSAIVDVGCGPGNESIPFSGMFDRVYSVDSSPRMLDRLRAECTDRGIGNITIIESDCLDAQVPERCSVAHSCLCPGMFSEEGMRKLELLSDDLCVFVGHLYEEECIERRIFEVAGLPFESRFDTLRILEKFRGDRDIHEARFSDFPVRRREELLQRCLRIAGNVSEEKTAEITEIVGSLKEEDLVPENNVIVLWWHRR